LTWMGDHSKSGGASRKIASHGPVHLHGHDSGSGELMGQGPVVGGGEGGWRGWVEGVGWRGGVEGRGGGVVGRTSPCC